MRSAWVMAILVTATLAGCTDADEGGTPGATSPPPETGSPADPEPQARIEVDLDVEPQDMVVPADVQVSFTLAPPNPAGSPPPTGVNWTLRVHGHPLFERTGHSLTFSDTWRFQERGDYTVEVLVGADGYRPSFASTSFSLLPKPLEVTPEAPPNATKGDWFNVTGSASQGYTDAGYACAWASAEPGALQVAEPGACRTQARWLAEGNRTLTFKAHDGVGNASVSLAMEVFPLVPLDVPDAAPQDPHVEDDAQDSETTLARTDIRAVWFTSDLEHLYVGMQVEDLPDASAETAGTYYRVNFTHDWNATAVGATGGFRVVASQAASVDPSGPGPAPMEFSLEADDGETWTSLGGLPDAALDRDADILWWVVPRSLLAAPLQGGVISGFFAEAGVPDGPGQFQDEASADSSHTLA